MSLNKRLNNVNHSESGVSASSNTQCCLDDELNDESADDHIGDYKCTPTSSCLEKECPVPGPSISGTICSEDMLSSGTESETSSQQSLRDCLKNVSEFAHDDAIFEDFELPEEVLVNTWTQPLPHTSSTRRRNSQSTSNCETAGLSKSPRKAHHVKDVCKVDIISGSQLIQEGRTYRIDPEKNYFRLNDRVKEVKTYCFVCRKKVSAADSIHPPKNTAIMKSWLKSLSGGDPILLSQLEDRLKMPIVDNVLCSDHYDTLKTTFYLLGTRLPVPKFIRGNSLR